MDTDKDDGRERRKLRAIGWVFAVSFLGGVVGAAAYLLVYGMFIQLVTVDFFTTLASALCIGTSSIFFGSLGGLLAKLILEKLQTPRKPGQAAEETADVFWVPIFVAGAISLFNGSICGAIATSLFGRVW